MDCVCRTSFSQENAQNHLSLVVFGCIFSNGTALQLGQKPPPQQVLAKSKGIQLFFHIKQSNGDPQWLGVLW